MLLRFAMLPGLLALVAACGGFSDDDRAMLLSAKLDAAAAKDSANQAAIAATQAAAAANANATIAQGVRRAQ